jgi:hypothetical protein
MSGTARPRKPLILMSDDVQPAHWDASGESEIVARLAVCQDIWGRNSFAPGQYLAMRQAATVLALNKSQIYGAIGVNLGGFGFVTEELGAHVELFEADPLLYDFNGSNPHFLGKHVKLERWVPGEQRLKANRYHRLSTFGAFAAAPDPAALVHEITAALKPGGYLYIDEIWANDAASARQSLLPAQGGSAEPVRPRARVPLSQRSQPAREGRHPGWPGACAAGHAEAQAGT